MLRHYHDLGILVPADVDDVIGHRRYEEAQLTDLLQVLALKGLGFSLTDVKRVMEGGLGPSELPWMLTLRRAQLRSEIDETAARPERDETHSSD